MRLSNWIIKIKTHKKHSYFKLFLNKYCTNLNDIKITDIIIHVSNAHFQKLNEF